VLPYWFWLLEFEISYDLKERAPEFWIAVSVAGLLMIALAGLLAMTISRWFVALPMVLFNGLRGRQALRASEQATAPHRRQLAAWLVAWGAVPILLSGLVSLVIGWLADAFVPRDGSHFSFVVVWLGGLLLISGLANFAILVGSTILFSLFMVCAYRSIAASETMKSVTFTARAPDIGRPRAMRGGLVLLASAA